MTWCKESPIVDCDRLSFLADAHLDDNMQCIIWSSKSHILFRGTPSQKIILSNSEKNSAPRLHLPSCVGKKKKKTTTHCQCWCASKKSNSRECQGEGLVQFCRGMGKGGGRMGARGRRSKTMGEGEETMKTKAKLQVLNIKFQSLLSNFSWPWTNLLEYPNVTPGNEWKLNQREVSYINLLWCQSPCFW